ncbi:MAG: SpoIIE family protein phosphatase [Calditrichia bacterium]|nr:SpoIIE family protein phosphatase [Calditrichia bacterium]
MFKSIVLKIISGIIYLALYTFLRFVFSIPEEISLLIVILFIFILHNILESAINYISEQVLSVKNKKFIQALDHFENRLNDISHYHELFPEFYHLFNTLFPEKSWLFYVFEESLFRMIKYDTSKVEENLPEEIKYQIENDEKIIINLREPKTKTAADLNFKTDLFLEHDLDSVIPIKGKTQIVALIFTEESNLEFINNTEIAKRAERTLLRAGQILEHTALYLDVIQRNLEIKKIFEVSQKLLTSLNTEEILEFLLDALAEVIPFDAGVIFLFDPETKKLFKKASKGYEEGIDFTLKIGQGACGRVAETRRISLIKNVESADHYYPIRPQTRSQVSIPLERQNELMGVLSLESDEVGYFTFHSIELLNLFANQAVIALYNAKQYEISLTKTHLEHELINAAKVQKVLLPQRSPFFENLRISFSHIPSKLVSGDLFDLAGIDDKTLGLVVGDVSGKGAGAAIMMSLVLAGFRAYKKSRLAVCEVVARLNNLLEESVSDGRFATLFYALILTKKNQITFTNAGHNPPFLFRSNGDIEELSGGGIVLGYLANQNYIQKTIPFNRGDILLTYTDGITEALNIEGEEFGEERLKQVVKENTDLNCLELKDKILEKVDNHTKSDLISDDRTMVIVKYM